MAKITKCYNYRNKLNAEGKAQIVIRISVGKEKKYFNTGYWIEPHFWDEKKAEVKKTYPNFQKINQRLNYRKKFPPSHSWYWFYGVVYREKFFPIYATFN